MTTSLVHFTHLKEGLEEVRKITSLPRYTNIFDLFEEHVKYISLISHEFPSFDCYENYLLDLE